MGNNNQNNGNRNNGNNNSKPSQDAPKAPADQAPTPPAGDAPSTDAPLAELAKKEDVINANVGEGESETPSVEQTEEGKGDETPAPTEEPTAPAKTIDDIVGSQIAPSQAEAPAPAVKSPEEQTVEMISHHIDAYIAGMAPGKPLTAQTGAGHQTNLYNLLRQILKMDGQLFSKCWTALLGKVRDDETGVFGEKYVFRFFDATKLDASQRSAFQNLLHLIINTADPRGRQAALKLIDLPNATKPLSVPGAAEKLISYYAL